MKVLLPRGWKPPVGYANGIESSGRMVFVAGQVGWNEKQVFRSEDLAVQFEQALKNVIAVLADAGARPEHVCRMSAYCCDKPAYLAARSDEYDFRVGPPRLARKDRARGDRRDYGEMSTGEVQCEA